MQVCRAQEIDLMLDRHRGGHANFTRELRAQAALALWGRGTETLKAIS